ncbi:hypothetical protein F2P81_015749 [Scophthalmus maximus]|uniref:PDZ domain-containing protein n=1 Tax=Scophthalmus maximus TaxID=52904 RepID=A0A6A4SJN0_SCOMX|nr:hypothetical protein F2P81_015749 [Scophthalmus maximus]
MSGAVLLSASPSLASTSSSDVFSAEMDEGPNHFLLKLLKNGSAAEQWQQSGGNQSDSYKSLTGRKSALCVQQQSRVFARCVDVTTEPHVPGLTQTELPCGAVLKGSKKLSLSVRSVGRIPGGYVTNHVYTWVDPQGRGVSPPPDLTEHRSATLKRSESQRRSNMQLLQEGDEKKVNLVLDDGRSLGLMIRGGAEYALGIYITGVDQGSAAACGGLKFVSHSVTYIQEFIIADVFVIMCKLMSKSQKCSALRRRLPGVKQRLIMKDEVLGTGPVYTVGWKYNEGEEEKKERQESVLFHTSRNLSSNTSPIQDPAHADSTSQTCSLQQQKKKCVLAVVELVSVD